MDDEQRPSAAEVPSLDGATLGTLVEMLDDDDVVADIIRTFLRETPPQLLTLEHAASVGDTDTATGAAHAIRGAAQILGALRLGDLCAAFEEDPEATPSRRVLEEYERVARELRTVAERLGTAS